MQAKAPKPAAVGAAVAVVGRVCNHLAGIDELWLALGEERDYDAAAKLGPAYRADLRLLEDLGWAPEESGGSFALTMTAGELVPLLQRLREEARSLSPLAGQTWG